MCGIVLYQLLSWSGLDIMGHINLVSASVQTVDWYGVPVNHHTILALDIIILLLIHQSYSLLTGNDKL